VWRASGQKKKKKKAFKDTSKITLDCQKERTIYVCARGYNQRRRGQYIHEEKPLSTFSAQIPVEFNHIAKENFAA